MTLPTCDVSIVIPTRNGAARLPLVLKALEEQVGCDAIRWEIVVVDNGSTDNTLDVVRTLQTGWSRPDVPVTCCQVTRAGVHPARQGGVQAARGSWIAFLDDDNIPDPDWLAEGWEFAGDASLGVFGGRITCVYESAAYSPSRGGGVDSIHAANGDESVHDYGADNTVYPPGAGLFVRAVAWKAAVPQELPMLGRLGRLQLAGDDTLAVGLIRARGWRVAHNPTMHLQHLIPATRLTLEALATNALAAGITRVIPRLFRVADRSAPLALLLMFGAWCQDGWRWMWVRHRSLEHDSLASERLVLRKLVEGTFVGPWVFWREGVIGEIWRLTRRGPLPISALAGERAA